MLISYVIAGIVCAFAGLCYAELASTLPVSGSAYTYSYTTIGEFAAWVMGALLLLEYGLAASVVAVGWSGYVVSLLGDIGIHIPADADRARPAIRKGAGVDGTTITTVFNLPAFLVCAALALLLVIGVSESAKVNNVIVAIKVTVLVAFILVGGFIILSELPSLRAQLGSVHPASRPARRASSAGAASCAPPRSSSSPISASRRSRPPARKPRTRRRTCRSGSSARWSPARSSTSWCRSC